MAQRKLIENEKYFLAIADTTIDMVHINDLEGRIVYANNATETTLGYPLDEIINSKATDIIHSEDREIIKNDMLSFATGKNLQARDIRLLKKDGSYIDVEVRGFAVTIDENNYIGAIISDISKRKETEKQLADYRDNLEKLVQERTQKLEKALAEIKTLEGILPICMHCNKIRDDEGYWKQIETYIHERTEAEFSHSVCPECIEQHYSKLKIK